MHTSTFLIAAVTSAFIVLVAAGGPAYAGTTVTTPTASPATISFNAVAPETQIAGSSQATVSFSINGSNGNTWSLSVGTGSTTFPSCTSIPITAVTVRCSAASITSGGGHGATAACVASSYTPLTTSGVTIANGLEQNQTATYSVTLDYQLADSWQYIPNTCPLTITYTVNAP